MLRGWTTINPTCTKNITVAYSIGTSVGPACRAFLQNRVMNGGFGWKWSGDKVIHRFSMEDEQCLRDIFFDALSWWKMFGMMPIRVIDDSLRVDEEEEVEEEVDDARTEDQYEKQMVTDLF